MRRAVFRRTSQGLALFPFLAVLICTMGSLIVLLVLVLQQARVQGGSAVAEAVEEAQRKAGVAAKQVSLVDKQYKQALRALDVANRQKDATDKRTNALLATEE
ncbi:MAG: hypothetical protein ACKPEY_19705, partial [Planctomycetota bacterium]